MTKNPELARFRRQNYFMAATSAVVAAGGLAIGVVGATTIAWLFGLAFLGLGVAFAAGSVGSARRLFRIYQAGQITPMWMGVEVHEDSDHTSVFLELGLPDTDAACWRMQVRSGGWDPQSFVGQKHPVHVYIDPSSERPAIVQTADERLLWRLAGSSVKRLES